MPDNAIHFLEVCWTIQGRKWTGFAERDCDRLGFANTVDDILTGQVEGVRKVYRGDLETGRFEDVTVEVAEHLLFRLRETNTAPAGDVLDLIEDALSCRAVADFLREMEAA